MPKKKKNIEKVFFTIGEVAEAVNVSPSTIRYWERNFDELAPRKSSGGTRMFSADDIEVIKLIHHLVKERGLTVKGAQMKLKHNREDTENSWEIARRLKDVRNTLIEIKKELDLT